MFQDFPLWDCGDGYSRPNAAAIFPKDKAVYTSDHTITAAEAAEGKAFSNYGASGAVVLTAPTPKVGLRLFFAKETVGQDFKVDVPAGVSINGMTAGKLMKNVTTETGVAVLELVGMSSTSYAITYRSGAWVGEDDTGLALSALEQGADGQVIIGQTGSAPVYHTVTGDVTITAAGATAIGAGKVTSAMLTTTMATGYINIPLASFRLIASNDIPNKNATDGGTISKDTDPILERTNAATDKSLRISWASASVIEIQAPTIAYPPDLDDAAAVTINFIAGMKAGSVDTPVLTVSAWEGVGDANAGGNTAALSTTAAKKTVTVAAGDVGAYPKAFNFTVAPGTHATGSNDVYLYACWIEYTRK